MSIQKQTIKQSPRQEFHSTITGRIKQAGVGRIALAIAAVTVAGLVAVLAGCASAPPPKEVHMVWPEPPEQARVEFVRSIVGDEDLGNEITSSQKVLKFLEGEKASLNRIVEPMGLAVSDDGNRLYVADHAQSAVFIFDFAKKTMLKIGGQEKPLSAPMGIALDAQENFYVAEQTKKGVSVYSREGKQLRFITDASISRPTGVAVDSARNKLYVADTGHSESDEHTVKIFNLEGKLLGHLGQGKGDLPGSFLFPTYVSVDAKGNVYVSDTVNSRIQMFDADGKFVQQVGKRGNGWGMFDKPKGVALDSFGNVYVNDSGWCNTQIFNSKGQIMLFFGGRGTVPGLMQNPSSLAIDKQNRIYVGDLLNHRINVYQLVNTTAADSAPQVSTAPPQGDAAKSSTTKGEEPSQNPRATKK
jgi:DNA-binding beta-propeller fold protein YncE